MPTSDSSTNLDLKKLKRLDQALRAGKAAGSYVYLDCNPQTVIYAQLRPLLDLVEKMGEGLRGLGYDGYDGQRHIKSCPSGQTYWLGRECTSQCAEVRTALEAYRRAKGENVEPRPTR